MILTNTRLYKHLPHHKRRYYSYPYLQMRKQRHKDLSDLPTETLNINFAKIITVLGGKENEWEGGAERISNS